MIAVYKKIEKCKDNLSGYENIDEQDILKPFLFCIPGQDVIDKSVFGIIREAARTARVYTSVEPNEMFKVNEMPIDFLGSKFEKDENYQNKADELVDKIFFPFLIKDGLSLESLKRRANYMNFFTYCNGTFMYKNIEECLIEKLRSIKLSDEQIKKVISKIKLVSIATDFDRKKLNCKSFTFLDVNDEEIYSIDTLKYIDILKSHNKEEACIKENEGCTYIYNGNGNHSLKEYSKDDNFVKAAVCFAVTNVLQSSLNDKDIDMDLFMSKLLSLINSNTTCDERIRYIDDNLEYGTATRYTKMEAKYRKELDDAYKKEALLEKNLTSARKEAQNAKSEREKLIECIRTFSSDTTFYQIVCSAGLWNMPSDDPFDKPTDKKIRELYENMLEEYSETQSMRR